MRWSWAQRFSGETGRSDRIGSAPPQRPFGQAALRAHATLFARAGSPSCAARSNWSGPARRLFIVWRGGGVARRRHGPPCRPRRSLCPHCRLQRGWSGERLDMFEHAAQLHDIGKIGVPDSIMLKPGKLSEEEFKLMRRTRPMANRSRGSCGARVNASGHTKSARLRPKPNHPFWRWPPWSDEPPRTMGRHRLSAGPRGRQIPIEGRITAVADVFDALRAAAPFKPAFPLDECFRIMEEGRGTHLTRKCSMRSLPRSPRFCARRSSSPILPKPA